MSKFHFQTANFSIYSTSEQALIIQRFVIYINPKYRVSVSVKITAEAEISVADRRPFIFRRIIWPVCPVRNVIKVNVIYELKICPGIACSTIHLRCKVRQLLVSSYNVRIIFRTAARVKSARCHTVPDNTLGEPQRLLPFECRVFVAVNGPDRPDIIKVKASESRVFCQLLFCATVSSVITCHIAGIGGAYSVLDCSRFVGRTPFEIVAVRRASIVCISQNSSDVSLGINKTYVIAVIQCPAGPVIRSNICVCQNSCDTACCLISGDVTSVVAVNNLSVVNVSADSSGT